MQLHSNEQHAFDTQDIFLYTRLMTMFSQKSSDCSRALHIFDSMQSRGIKPDLIAYNTAINAAGEISTMWPPSLKHHLYCYLLLAQLHLPINTGSINIGVKMLLCILGHNPSKWVVFAAKLSITMQAMLTKPSGTPHFVAMSLSC